MIIQALALVSLYKMEEHTTKTSFGKLNSLFSLSSSSCAISVTWSHAAGLLIKDVCFLHLFPSFLQQLHSVHLCFKDHCSSSLLLDGRTSGGGPGGSDFCSFSEMPKSALGKNVQLDRAYVLFILVTFILHSGS